MAFRVLRACSIITNSLKKCHAINNVTTIDLVKPTIPLQQNVRTTNSFFNKRTAEYLWKGVTSVSNAGRRRGRAKGLARKKDLNRGQIIGVGKIPIQFPGLNAPVFQGRELLEQRMLPPDATREEKLIKLRQSLYGRKRVKLSALERGWTSARPGGRKIGPPDPVGEDKFDGFESWILEAKSVTIMTGNMGRKKQAYAFVVTGNGNGLVGFAYTRASDHKTAIRKAKNKAALRLLYIPRYNDHTIIHDFYAQFGNAKIYVQQMHEGYGLVCHRALKVCCEAVGIKDIYAKCEGSKNLQSLIKAFFIGLLRQKTHQRMANEKKLHVVEFRKETNYFPNVIASPAEVRKSEEIPFTEILDYKQYLLDGKIRLQRKKYVPFYTQLPSYDRYLKKQERTRGHDELRLQLAAEYGDVRSFLAEKYPECTAPKLIRKPKEEEEEVMED